MSRQTTGARNLQGAALVAVAVLTLCSCRAERPTTDAGGLVGNWSSQSISTRSRFLEQTVARLPRGAYRLVLKPDGQFSWSEPDNKAMEGHYYLDEVGGLVIEFSPSGEVVHLTYERDGDRLVLHTQDGFVFEMGRETNR